jgi:hypothetical protein
MMITILALATLAACCLMMIAMVPEAVLDRCIPMFTVGVGGR